MSLQHAVLAMGVEACPQGMAHRPAMTGSFTDAHLTNDATANLPWYVVHTKVRQEQVAADNLMRQGFAVYLPKIRLLKRIRRRLEVQQEPLFPRYLFVRPGSAAASIAPVRSTTGVTTLVRFGQEPAVMRAGVLESIRAFEARRNEAPDEDLSPFQPGARICVADGPLTGMEGLISDVSHERVVVLMQLLGQETRVRLSHHQLVLAQ